MYVSNQPPNISSRYGLTDIKEFKENKEEHKMVNMEPISDVGSVRGPFRCQRVDASNSLLNYFFIFVIDNEFRLAKSLNNSYFEYSITT